MSKGDCGCYGATCRRESGQRLARVRGLLAELSAYLRDADRETRTSVVDWYLGAITEASRGGDQ